MPASHVRCWHSVSTPGQSVASAHGGGPLELVDVVLELVVLLDVVLLLELVVVELLLVVLELLVVVELVALLLELDVVPAPPAPPVPTKSGP
jgi:hypothetical protein